MRRLSLELEHILADKEKQFRRYKEQVDNIPQKEIQQINRLKLLSDLADRESKIKEDIFQLQSQFSEASFRCEAIRMSLGSRLEIISRIRTCANKKNYYNQLRNKLAA